MYPKGHIEFGDFLEDGQEVRFIQRASTDICKNLGTHGAEFRHGALDLLHGCRRVVHGQRGNKPGKAMRMLGNEFGQTVVGDFREFRRFVRIGEGFDRRQRHAWHLHVIAKFIHDAEAHIEINERRDFGDSLLDGDSALGEDQHAVVKCLGEYVAEQVNFHWALESSHPQTTPDLRKWAGSYQAHLEYVNASAGRHNFRPATARQHVNSLSIRARQAGGADRRHCRRGTDAAWRSSTRKNAALSRPGPGRSPNIFRAGPFAQNDSTRRWRERERAHLPRLNSNLWHRSAEQYAQRLRRETGARTAWARLQSCAFWRHFFAGPALPLVSSLLRNKGASGVPARSWRRAKGAGPHPACTGYRDG